MRYCSICGNRINDGTLFCPKCGNRVGVVVNVQQQHSHPFEQQKPFKPDSNLVFAIVTTCLFCVPLGLYAIILANKVDYYYDLGEYEKAEMTAKDAKKWSIIGMVGGFFVQVLIFIILYICITIGVIAEEL